MKITEFLNHYGLNTNPFAEEDAQTDPVFKNSCIKSTHHPVWDKLYGAPQDPSTAILFGEKGAGKTALRLQLIRELSLYNTDNPHSQSFVIDYSDLNRFLDCFRDNVSRRKKIGKVLSRLQLQDHIDAILSLGVTQFIDRVLVPTECHYAAANDVSPIDLSALSKTQVRELLYLMTAYDQGRDNFYTERMQKIINKTHFSDWKSFFQSWRDFCIAILGSILVATIYKDCGSFAYIQWYLWALVIFWAPWLWKILTRFWKSKSVKKTLRVLNPETRKIFSSLMLFSPDDYAPLELPKKGGTENRYALLARFLEIIKHCGFNGIVILVDRVDEPYLITGSPELMKSVIWPIMDNKLLKYENIGFKFLLPDDLYHFMKNESKSFHDRARLDKQNVIPSLSWTGETLLDLANDRINACYTGNGTVSIFDFLDPDIDKKKVIDHFAQLRVPRHLFKFLHDLLREHVGTCSSDSPAWKISQTEFETRFAVYNHNREEAQRNGNNMC